MNRLLLFLRRHGLRAAINLGIVLAFLLHALHLMPWPLLDALENLAYDARVRLTLMPRPDPRIVIVDIDERSLDEIGRWPWGRDVLARLLDQLFDQYQIDLAAFDVVFAEPDRSSGLHVLEQLAAGPLRDQPAFLQTLENLRPRLDYDAGFARALADRRVVLGYAMVSRREGASLSTGQLPAPAFPRAEFAGQPIEAASYVGNLPAFQNAALGGGHFAFLPDEDGVTRRTPMLYAWQDGLYESLSLAVARLYLGIERPEWGGPPSTGSGSGGEHLRLGAYRIPVNAHLETLIPFRGPRGSFPYLSLADVLHGRVPDPAILRDAIVLIGTTATGLFDARATPISEVYPGVEIHANLIAGILDQHLLGQPASMLGAEVLALAACGLLLIIILPLLSPFWATALSLATALGVAGFNLSLWQNAHLVMPLASSLLLILLLFLFNMSYGYFVEARGRHHALRLFGQYVPRELVAELSRKQSAELSLEGESREMTVLFSDVRDFTTLSEGLEPRQLSELMNRYLTPMTQVIHKHRGTIDKYMGDAIMAFWGAPLADPQHARHALEAALAMLDAAQTLRAEFQAQGWPALKIGIGLHTGVMNVGNMGSEFRMAYTVMGDAVNLGSRLEGLTKQYGVTLIVSEQVKLAVPDYAYQELDRVRVKGKEQPVAIYAPISPADNLNADQAEELARHHAALADYRAARWAAAAEDFCELARRWPDRVLYRLYLERIAYFRDAPPPAEWDGVFTHTSK